MIPATSAFGGLSENHPMTPAPRLDLRPGVSEPVVLMISRREAALEMQNT